MPTSFVPKYVLLAMGILGMAGCDLAVNSVLSDPDVTTAEENSKETDEYAAEVIAGKNEDGEFAVPAAEFFAEGSPHQIWKGDRNAFKQLCEKSIAAGAPAAYAVMSKEVPFCSSYIITMPNDKAARAKVIEVHNQFWKDLSVTPVPNADPDSEAGVDMDDELVDYMAKDIGQKYLNVVYDP